jgi:iron(III) transport system permease protein
VTAVVCAGLALTVGLPLVALLAIAVTRSAGLPPVPENWTLDNFRSVADASTAAALARSGLLAGVAATLLTVLGAVVAGVERRRGGVRILGSLVTFTLVLPGSTLAVAMLIAYGRWLGGSLLLILIAYLAKFWAFTHRSVAGALDGLPRAEVHAARASGAGRLTAIRTVVLRQLAPALLGGWLLVFLTALHEITMSSLLYGPGGETFAVVVLNSHGLGQIGRTAALSVLLGLAVLLPGLALWAVLRKPHKGAIHAG